MNDELKEIINTLDNEVFIIEDEMSNKKNYKKLINTVFDYLRAGFEVKELREAPVKYKFHRDSEEHTMQLRHFLTNLIFWSPMIDLGSVEDMDDHIIVDTSKISSGYIENYLNTVIIEPYREKVSNKKMNKLLHNVIFDLSRISTDFNIILGLTINIETFIDMANKDERFNQIIHTKLDDSMQPSDIEKVLDDLMHEEIDILKNNENALQPMLKSGTGIKHKQLAELSISGGLKPDISGNTMPKPINSNLIVNGLGTVSNYYIDAVGGRKSLIANKTTMGKSGYFVKKVMLSVSDIKLDTSGETCNTVRPIKYEIKTKEHLNRLVGRMYRKPNGHKYNLLTGRETELIGTEIYVKSPTTCSCKDGVCKACYGPLLYHTNKDGLRIGTYAGAIITNPVSQSILSTKHLLTTTSERVEFDESFHKFFSLSANEIIINSNIENPEDYSLVILDDNIVTLDELSEGDINEFLTMFHVKNNKTGEIFEINEKSMKEFYLSTELADIMGRHKRRKDAAVYEVSFMDIPDDTKLFLIEIANNELTKPLYSIMGILDSKKKKNAELGNNQTVSDICQRMLDLLIESHISAQAVHSELLIYPLIRSLDNVLERPDFSKYQANDNYQILTVAGALEKHPSPLVGLSSAYLERQLKSPLTFKKRGSSVVDAFFKETL